MSEIRLEDASIQVDGQWLTADDLSAMIKNKIDSGEMKIAQLAAALEELNSAMENTRVLEESVVISKSEYEKLKKIGGEDDNGNVRKAIMAYIAKGKASIAIEEKTANADTPQPVDSNTSQAVEKSPEPNSSVKCTGCRRTIEVPSNERPIVIDCPHCGTSCRLTL